MPRPDAQGEGATPPVWEQRSRLGEPLNKLGVPLGMQQVLGSAPDTRVVLRQAKVYEEGVRFELTVIASNLEEATDWLSDQLDLSRATSDADHRCLRFFVEYANLTIRGRSRMSRSNSLEEPFLGVGCGSAMGDVHDARLNYVLFLAPLPLDSFRLGCEWADPNIGRRTVLLEGDHLRQVVGDVVSGSEQVQHDPGPILGNGKRNNKC